MNNKVSKELSKHRLQQAKDDFVVEADDTKEQIGTARELLVLVETYIEGN